MDLVQFAAGLLCPASPWQLDVVKQRCHAPLEIGDAKFGFFIEA